MKAVAQAIPTYAMSIFKLPKDLCSSIQAMINRFSWSHAPSKRKIHWVWVSILCDRKEEGGLGLRDLEAFDRALLAKQVWRLIQDETSLVAQKSKYFPTTDILSANIDARLSYTWRGLYEVKEVIIKDSRWLSITEIVLLFNHLDGCLDL